MLLRSTSATPTPCSASSTATKLVAVLADQDRRPGHRRRARPDVPRAARRRRRRGRPGSPPARRCRRCCAQLRTMLTRYYADVPAVVVEPGVRTGVPLLYRQPQGGRLRPDRQHAGRVPPLRRAVDRRRLRHLDELRRGQREGRVPRRRARARHRDLRRRAGARAAQLRKVELTRPRSVIGKNTVEACSPASSTASPARSTAWSAGSTGELGAPATVIATGGLAPVVIDGVRDDHRTTSPTSR